MYCIHLSFIYISWLVGWLMYLLGECCASCSSMIHDPPSIYLLSFFHDHFWITHSKRGVHSCPLDSSPIWSTPRSLLFSFFAFSFVSIQDLSFFTSVTSLFCLIWTCHPRGSCFFSFPSFLFFVSLGFVTCCSCVHAPLFFCPLACFHSFHASMRRYFFVRSCFWWLLITDWLLMTWLHASLMMTDCLMEWHTDKLITVPQTYSTTEDDRSAKCSFNAKNFIMYIFPTIAATRICWRTVFVEIL